MANYIQAMGTLILSHLQCTYCMCYDSLYPYLWLWRYRALVSPQTSWISQTAFFISRELNFTNFRGCQFFFDFTGFKFREFSRVPIFLWFRRNKISRISRNFREFRELIPAKFCSRENLTPRKLKHLRYIYIYVSRLKFNVEFEFWLFNTKSGV